MYQEGYWVVFESGKYDDLVVTLENLMEQVEERLAEGYVVVGPVQTTVLTGTFDSIELIFMQTLVLPRQEEGEEEGDETHAL